MKNINLKLEMGLTFTKVLMLAAAAPYLLAVDAMAFLCDLARSAKTKTKLKNGVLITLVVVIAIHFAESLLSESNEVIFETIKIALFMLKGLSLNIVGTAIKVLSTNVVFVNFTIVIGVIAATTLKIAPIIFSVKQKNNYELGIVTHRKWLPAHSYLNLIKNYNCFK